VPDDPSTPRRRSLFDTNNPEESPIARCTILSDMQTTESDWAIDEECPVARVLGV